ncbi:MAG: acyl-CoA desaturase [Bacteroidia bacterium]
MSEIVRFNNTKNPEFYNELRTRVNTYFQSNNISKNANLNMVLKTVFMLGLYFVPLVLMLTGVITSLGGVIFMWCLMGFGMSGIGMGVMHDANHGSYSQNSKINKILGFTVNFAGGYHTNWIIQHNVLHHTFTNIEGYDEDIEQKVMRFSPNQKRHKLFKYQLFYAPFIYGLLTIYWVLAKDFIQLVDYNKRGLIKKQGLSYKKALTQIIVNKTWYFVIILVLPLILIPLPWWQVLLGFFCMHFISGLILALIFQPAHVLEETEFFVPDENTSVENSWAVHQMKTTSNFANGSIFFSWFIGGLNYQIEHHLFPLVCHVHYKKISSIVKQTAEEYNLPYHQHKTFLGALRSHFSLLHKLGTGEYDLAKAS